MDKHQAVGRYPGKEKIIQQYKDADTEVVVNQDSDLRPIHIPTPIPPEWHLIDGFGKPAKDQKWKPPWIPRRILDLQNRRGLTIDEIWNELEGDQQKYKEEIDYIKRMWYHRLYGYWFFNNGQPTYITGKHFYYMTSYKIDVGLPKYRSRDRKYWIAIKFFENHTLDFIDKDDKGNAIPKIDEDGNEYFEMYDTGRRVCFGDAYPKMRREGATFRAECNNLETISKLRGAKGGIQSRNDGDAKKVFTDKLVKPFKKVPFFFKPTYAGSTDPKSELVFDVPSVRVGGKGAMASVDTGLESLIDFEVGDEGAYDGQKLFFHHDDEVGKNRLNNVLQRHIVTKECLSQGGGYSIHGYTSKTSTVGEMEKGGGRKFQEMCDMSNFYQRNEIGQTATGLFLLFISSTDGMEGCVDEYGVSDEEKALKIIKAQRKALRDAGNIEQWIEKVRQYPIRYRECFTTSSNDMGFNLLILEDRLSELRVSEPPLIQGAFSRKSRGDRTSEVMFTEDPMGRFIISKQVLSFQSNRIYTPPTGIGYAPYKAGKFNVGADPFAFNQTEGGQMSDGGIAVKWKFDPSIDDISLDPSQWESDRFVCTYQHRPATKADYVDDVLMVAMYFGAMVLTESNVQEIIDKFRDWGFGGFLKHMRDSATGGFRKTPGYPTTGGSKQAIFNALRDYVERRGMWEYHKELLQDCYDIQSVKQMTHYDRLTASGLAELAEESDHGDFKTITKEKSTGYGLPVPMRSMD